MFDELFWWSRFYIEKNKDTKTVYDLLGEYKCFLETYHSERCKSFDKLCSTEPEAARAEAVVFSFFKWNGYAIQVEETGNEGGVDFRAQKDTTEFVVEVTSIRRETFTGRSGTPENLISDGSSSDPYEVPRLIRSKLSSKADQMSGYDCPRILVITCEHPEYEDILLNKEAFGANMFLTSPPKIGIPGGNNIIDLADSLFFKFQDDRDDRVVFCRESISAVLLFYISKFYTETAGLLHPKPAYNFSIELLPLVPFVEVLVPERVLTSEIKDYSVEDFDNQISTRWIPDNSPNGLFWYN